MDIFFGILFSAIIIEGLISYTKTMFVEGQFVWQIVVGLMLGIVVAVAYNLDIFGLFGMTSVVPYLGHVLTGILLSRGSNYMFDLIGKITKSNVEGAVQNED